ncbi:transcription factor doublesex isoform X1 [Temnothorax americanus]|uniref:transcription factor doublesex isoform X1 n=1 Tax=Temnothorax americanus TaxID=1964332 RepID=UPI004068CFA5
MNKEKKNESTSTDSDCSKTGSKKERTSPTCKRCEGHGVKNVLLKGHKRWCAFQDCNCLRCYIIVAEQKSSAMKIARKRALENDNKEKKAPEEIRPMPWTHIKKCNDLHVLINYTLLKIRMSDFAVLRDPLKMWYILTSLNKCAYDLDAGITHNAAWEFDANISRVIHGCPMIYHPETYCYFSPPPVMAKIGSPDEGQPVDIKFSQYPFPNLPILPPFTFPPPTLASPFPNNSFKPPTEPLIESSTEPSIESTDSSTDPFTCSKRTMMKTYSYDEASTPYCRLQMESSSSVRTYKRPSEDLLEDETSTKRSRKSPRLSPSLSDLEKTAFAIREKAGLEPAMPVSYQGLHELP